MFNSTIHLCCWAECCLSWPPGLQSPRSARLDQPPKFENSEAVCRFGGRVECCIRNLNSNILPPIYAVKNLGKYFYISNLKFTMNGCRHKIVIFYFFWEQGLNFLCAKFQVYGTSPSNFLPKNVKKNQKNIWQNIGYKILVVFHHLKKDLPLFVEKWAHNKFLLFNVLISLIFIA